MLAHFRWPSMRTLQKRADKQLMKDLENIRKEFDRYDD